MWTCVGFAFDVTNIVRIAIFFKDVLQQKKYFKHLIDFGKNNRRYLKCCH